MPARILTATNVLTLKPRRGHTRDIYFDKARGAPAGFALRVSATARSFYLIYGRGAESRKTKMWLGDATAMSLADARAKARAARDLLHKGMNPKDEEHRAQREREAEEVRRQQAHAEQATRPTLGRLVERFIDAHAKKYKAKTIAEYRRIHRTYLAGDPEREEPIAPHPLAAVFASDVRRYQLRELLEGIAHDAPVMSNRVAQVLRAAYTWGIREQLDDALETNPAAGLEVHDERPMPTAERTLTDAEVKKLWTGLDALDDEGRRKLSPETAAYIRLLLLCGTRRNETALADWRDVDLKAAEWTIPAANRKAAGRRGKVAEQRELTVPLPRLAKTILEELRTATGPAGPVFGSTGRTVMVNAHRFIEKVRGAVDVDFSLHDLRATCATGAGDCGAEPYVVSLILGHAALLGAAEATGRYDRSPRMREVGLALERWAKKITRLVSGEPAKSSVTQFRGRR